MNDSRQTQTNTRTIGRRGFLGGLAVAGASGALGVSADASAAETGAGKRGRPVCIFSKHLQFLDYAEAAETAAELGFDGLDIPVRPGGHVLPERVADDLPRAVEAAKKAGIEVPTITTAITSPDSPHAENVLSTAARLGVGYYRLGYQSYDETLGIAGSLEAYRPRLSALADMNLSIGIRGDYQNHAGTSVGGPVWDLWYALRDLDPRWIGCQYDIRHATVEGGTCWPLGLKLIGKFVGTTVVKDFKWGLVDGRWRVVDTHVGEGMVDFAAYYGLVRELNISGPISMHFEYPHELTRATVMPLFKKDLDALRKILAAAGLS